MGYCFGAAGTSQYDAETGDEDNIALGNFSRSTGAAVIDFILKGAVRRFFCTFTVKTPIINSMKTIILKAVMAISVIIGICIIISFSACKSPPTPPPPPEPVVELPQAPVLSLQDLRVESINKTMVELYVSVDLENPNGFELPQPRLAFDYQVYETSIIRSRLRNQGALPAYSTTNVIFGIIVYYRDLYFVFPELQRLRYRDAPSVLKMTCDLGVPVQNDEPTNLQVSYTLPLQW